MDLFLMRASLTDPWLSLCSGMGSLTLTTQVTSIGDIGPYRAPGRWVREVSYQPGSETLLSGLYRTYSGPNRYATCEINQDYTYRPYVGLIVSQRWWECKRWEDVWIGLIVLQLSTRCLLYRPLSWHTSPRLLLWERAARPIMLSGAHFFLLRSRGPDALLRVAKCFASLSSGKDPSAWKWLKSP